MKSIKIIPEKERVLKVDLNAPIIPGKSLAGIELGENISRYLWELNTDHYFNFGEKVKINAYAPMFIAYTIESFGLEIVVYVPEGEIVSLSVRSPYIGKWNGKVGIGMNTKELKEYLPDLRVSEGRLVSPEISGIKFSYPSFIDDLDSYNIYDFPDFILEEITIFNTIFY